MSGQIFQMYSERIEKNCMNVPGNIVNVTLMDYQDENIKGYYLAAILAACYILLTAWSQVVVERSKDKVIISGTPYYIHIVKKVKLLIQYQKLTALLLRNLIRRILLHYMV
ncbi:MAG: hypothetical protein MZV63_16420 [Marinilabiliales bacterium]|nr:hypothetical protein [Marinilabiliales bacterium]